MRSICLITPGHLASAPRVVKEADALAAAGYRVHVVAGRHYSPVDPLDAELFAHPRWTHTRVDYRGGPGAFSRKFLRRVARLALTRLPLASTALSARAHHAESLHLGAVAARTRAHLYIGHCLAGLPAAARAAAIHRTRYGFDAEDFHDAETREAANDPVDRELPRRLQSRLLPGAIHLTAAAPLIASELARVYGVRAATVLNAFPLAHAPREPVDPGAISAKTPAHVYWFSQTIGPGRGLETAISLLARLRTPVVLQLRGFVAPGYREELATFAHRAGLVRPVEFLPPAPPAEMVRLAARAHLGLSMEESLPRNRDLCLTNKVFVYLLAGIPQLLTPTSAQRALAAELGGAALLWDPARVDAPAAHLDALLGAPARLLEARAAAWRLGQSRFNWEHEQSALLVSVEAAFSSLSATVYR